MRLLKSLSLSSLSLVARVSAALVAFSVVARVLGVERFGVLMLCLSVASLLMIVASFGLVAFLLREIGREPDAAPTLMGLALGARLLVSAVLLPAGLLLAFVMPGIEPIPYLLLLGAMWVEGLTELFNAGFRARQRFDTEARVALAAALVNALGVAAVAWFTADLLAIAAAYLVTRCAVAWLTWRAVLRVVGPFRPAGAAAAWRQVRRSVSYAVDTVLTSSFGLVDSVVLAHYLGPAAVGVHQAGMRLFLAGTHGASVLANVFLPRAAAAFATDPQRAAAERTRLQTAFLVVGASLGLLMAAAAPWYVEPLFGPEFRPLVALMPWFGLLFAIKFAAAAWGVVLTASGLQGYRATASALHWVAVAAVAVVAVPAYGNLGWLFALVAGNVLLGVLYAARVFARNRSDVRTLGLTALFVAAFVPMLRWPP